MDLIDRVLSQLAEADSSPSINTVPVHESVQTQSPVWEKVTPLEMDRRRLKGPSPVKGSPQARFKDAILGNRGKNGTADQTSSRPRQTAPRSAPSLSLPRAHPDNAAVSIKQRPSSPVPPSTSQSMVLRSSDPTYERHSASSSKDFAGSGTLSHTGETASGGMPAAKNRSWVKPQFHPMLNAPRDFQTLHGYGMTEPPHSGTGSRSFQPPIMSESMGGGPPKGFAPASPHTTQAQLLSLECQRRRFNPQWQERQVKSGLFKCVVVLKDKTVSSDMTYSTAAEAKHAIAHKALKLVREWPLDLVPPPAAEKAAMNQMGVNMAYDRRGDRYRSESVAWPTRPVFKAERSGLNEHPHELHRLVRKIEDLVGGSLPPDVKTDPIAAKAYLAGFSLGSRCAETATSGAGASLPYLRLPQHQSSAAPRSSRSRSPRRHIKTRSSPIPTYRERSVPVERLDRDCSDRYRPASSYRNRDRSRPQPYGR